ncbi:SH3 domain-containing protein [Pedobacter cryotolerans]|uniref:SH3 domain-containing protein n=1 Tax=Pedobacter cryotolerans TaxID=2571270 RepID=A0A4U1C3F1_9SPHI|nr:SH3 domain-containing protein [Pedobacter cryotolerans]TKB99807.1 SH3 domain-containing protein [Pedobacter cryotolerans]
MTYKFPLFIITLLSFSIGAIAQDMYKVTADKLNVRETKDPTSKKVGFVPQNENVQVLDSTDAKYFKVKVTNGEGFVSSQYLTRVSPMPAKKADAPKVMVQQQTSKDNSKTIFIAFVAIIMLGSLFIIFKFLNNKVLMVLATCVVLAVGYLSYLTFIVEKSVAGKYLNHGDGDYNSFEFKANNVIIEDAYMDTLITTKYTVEGDIIKFKQQENTIMLLMRDDNTLVGEGFTRGTFTKQ